MSSQSADRYDQLKDQAWQAIHAGELYRALELLEEALKLARELAEPVLVDRTLCGRASVLVEIGRAAEVKPELRRLLLKAGDTETSFLASYTLARAYDVDGDSEKALFYAQIARRHAADLDQPEQLAASHNLLGNLMLLRCDFEGAFHEFQASMRQLPADAHLRRAIVLDNLGYCHACKGRLERAFPALFESVRICRRLGARSYEAIARLTLAYTYLLAGRWREALRHGRRSLGLAEGVDDRSTIKYVLFVLGEAEKGAGNAFAARFYFNRLQEEFYPGAPNVADLLLLLDVQNMINLKA